MKTYSGVILLITCCAHVKKNRACQIFVFVSSAKYSVSRKGLFQCHFNISNQRTLVANIFVLLFKGTTWKMTRTNCH